MGDRCYEHRTRCCVSCKEVGQEKVRPNFNTLTDAEREAVADWLTSDEVFDVAFSAFYRTRSIDAAIVALAARAKGKTP